MTDEEPEPFRMPADSDQEAPVEEAPAPEDEDVVAAESIADLIDEATRTAAEQAEAERRGDAPEDRSADVWGDPASVHERDAVWQQAEDDAASNVWDLEEEGDATWPTAAPTPTPGPAEPREPTPPREARADRPAAAAGMPAEDELEPEAFTFAVDEGGDAASPTPAPSPAPAGTTGDEEPETFSFPAGPGTTAPAALPDQPEDGGEEPEAFTYAVAEDDPTTASDQPDGGTAEADEVEEWTVPGADAADEDTAVDSDVWTFSVRTDQETPLADTASPRDDAGWHDLEAEQEAGWEVADLGPRAGSEAEESDAFIAAVQAHDDYDEDDDAPWTAPALADDEQYDDERDDQQGLPSADLVTAEVHDALGDLLGDGDQDAVASAEGPATPAATTAAAATPDATAPAAAAPDPDDVAGDAGFGDFDHLEDLDHLDDMAAAAVPEVGHDEPGADDAATGEGAPEAEIEQPLDAPTAARQVMEPGSVTFSSGGKKKRGLFG